MTIIQDLGEYKGNHLYIKREDLIPFSFGGNKARKAQLFFQEIDKGNYDCVVTYGSGSSNHCRVVANECCRRGMSCYIIAPQEASEPTFNSQMMKLFGAEITTVPVSEVHDTIDGKIAELRDAGKSPYFIEGGGHGNLGTEAYVQCYEEIKKYEVEQNIHFDYIFFASGTGTTHAGLVSGHLLAGDERNVVGISIARKNPRGRDVVIQSIRDYMGGRDKRVAETIETVLKTFGIPLDATYTGKAFMGMTEYISQHEIENKNILFIHTGGTPLFFDALNKLNR